MKMNLVSGSSIAVAAVALAFGGVAMTSSSPAFAKEVHCVGINACKGQSACKTGAGSCKGQNACKGQGYLPAKSAKACTKQGGTVG
jgi:hypothetical protein